MHDPAVYEDPYAFRPERFIRDGKLDSSVQDSIPFIFGFGRRFVGPQSRSFVVATQCTDMLLTWMTIGSVLGGTSHWPHYS